MCRFHSILGQTRNPSPECKPPILQDVGNLEQETTVTHTLTSLSLTPHSPVCKPPILQDVGNLEQETAVTHTLTSLSPHIRSLGWGMGRLQNTETVLLAQVCTKPHAPYDHRSGEGMLHFKIFKRYPPFPRRLCSTHMAMSMQTQVDLKCRNSTVVASSTQMKA